jgi:hypothetical protein
MEILMRIWFGAASFVIAAAMASPALASQGPGVNPGTAGPFARLVVVGIIGAMISLCIFALIKGVRRRLW